MCYDRGIGEKTPNKLERVTSMKKALALLLACMLCFSGIVYAETAIEATAENTLIVGSSTMNGDFIDGFGSSQYDVYVKTLIHAYYDTFELTTGGEYVQNPTVVKEFAVEEDEAGNKVYTFYLYDDLKWSDGSAITAKDYVGSILWKASPKWLEAGASSTIGMGLLGYDAYLAGDADVFAGVKLIDDYTFSCTIDAAELPYFYEYFYVAIPPMCMAVYAPGIEIESDENGSRFVEAKDGDVLAAMQNVAQTERFAPTVGCGPYKFVAFENGAVTCEINEYFKGDLNGDKPQIQYVVQKEVALDTNVDALIAGEIDLIPNVSEGDKIDAAKAASDSVTCYSYLRNGYGLIAFTCDFGPTADENVRWALAYLIDRNAVVDYALGGYGGTVDSQYGYAQWMYQDAGEELEEQLTPFSLNIEKANERLDQTEWIYEADGVTPWDASKATADGEYYRYNAAGEVLQINHIGTENVLATDAIEIQYTANAPLAGVKYTVTKSDFNALLDHYYYGYEKGDEREFHSFNLSVNMSAVFDPYTFSWHSDKCGTWENACQLADDELDELIMNLRSVDPGDNDAFIDAWIAYEVRWQELMPNIPLFSNEFFYLARNEVKGLTVGSLTDWANTVCGIYKSFE